MRRLAVVAVLGLAAYASPVDIRSSEAAPTAARPARATAARPAARQRAVAAAPSADDERRALAQLHDERARAAALNERGSAKPSRAARTRPPISGAALWSALAQCESNGNPRAVSKSGKYRGAFQFSIPTWRSLGYEGDPIDASYALQEQAAKRLQARSGWRQWPSCARRLGLL